MVCRNLPLIFVFGLIANTASAQLLGADQSGSFGANLILAESYFNITENSAANNSDTTSLNNIGLYFGGALGAKVDGDGGVTYGSGPDVSLLLIEQHFWLRTSDEYAFGIGGDVLNLNIANDPYGFEKLFGGQFLGAYHNARMMLSYRGGPVINSASRNLSNWEHILTFAFQVSKNPKRPVNLLCQALLIRFTAPDTVITQMANVSIGVNFGFF